MHKHTNTFTSSHGSMIGNRKRDYWYCLISLGCTTLEDPGSIWLPACCILYELIHKQAFICLYLCVGQYFLKSRWIPVRFNAMLCTFPVSSWVSLSVILCRNVSASVQLFSFTFPVRCMGQVVFGDISVCTEPVSTCLRHLCLTV